MNDRFDPRFDPAFQPGYEAKPPRRAPKSATSSNPAKAALESARDEVTAAPEAEGETASRQRANPYLVALTAMSVALIAGGLATSQWIRSLFQQDDIRLDLDFFTLDSLKIAAPLAVALGVAIGAGVLFVYAIRWNKSS